MNEADIFCEAIDLADPSARAAYLTAACGGNGSLRARVEALLWSHLHLEDFLERPAVMPCHLDVAELLRASNDAISQKSQH
jgi:hypothetical protein